MASTRETPRLIELGRLLRALRRRRDMDQKAIAALIGRSHTHVSRWETGKLAIDQGELERLLAILEATSEETSEALRLHKDASDPNWLQMGSAKDLGLLTQYERAAESITAVQPALIPGPLQVESYSRDMMLTAGEEPDRIEGALDRRMARREVILSGSTPYEAFIGELAIRFPACSAETAVDQLRDLVKVAELPHVSIRVVPFRLGWDPSREGGFVLIRTEGGGVVHLEELTTATTLSRAREVARYVSASTRIRDLALGAVSTVRMIAQVADELERM